MPGRRSRIRSGRRRRVSGALRRTLRQRRGAGAEGRAAVHLTASGWRLLARNVRLGRDEIDIVMLDPGPPAALVAVEVRSAATARYGAPEERVDEAKLRALYRAAAALRRLGRLPDGSPLPRLPVRVDLVVVDAAPPRSAAADGPTIRHYRALEPR